MKTAVLCICVDCNTRRHVLRSCRAMNLIVFYLSAFLCIMDGDWEISIWYWCRDERRLGSFTSLSLRPNSRRCHSDYKTAHMQRWMSCWAVKSGSLFNLSLGLRNFSSPPNILCYSPFTKLLVWEVLLYMCYIYWWINLLWPMEGKNVRRKKVESERCRVAAEGHKHQKPYR